VSGADPYPERPCETLVIVVSVMNSSFSFQNVYSPEISWSIYFTYRGGAPQLGLACM
jgi:hypothetical protein